MVYCETNVNGNPQERMWYKRELTQEIVECDEREKMQEVFHEQATAQDRLVEHDEEK